MLCVQKIGALSMEIDYKLVIAIIALGLSIYNFFSSRRISTLEKRTQVMSEIGEVQIFYAELHEIYIALTELTGDRSTELKELLIKAKVSLEDTINRVSEMFESMNRGDNLNSAQYEKLRPMLQQVHREGKIVLENARNIKNQALELSNNA